MLLRNWDESNGNVSIFDHDIVAAAPLGELDVDAEVVAVQPIAKLAGGRRGLDDVGGFWIEKPLGIGIGRSSVRIQSMSVA